MRLLRSHPILRLDNSYLVVSTEPLNFTYSLNFYSLLANMNLYITKIGLCMTIAAFIPLWLEWNIPYFFLLVLLSLGGVIFIWFMYNNSKKNLYFDGDILAMYMGNYDSLVDKAIANSPFNEKLSAILIISGIAMIIVNLFHNKKDMSIMDRIMYMWRNWKIIFIFALVIFIINMVLYLLGLAILIDTSSITLFLYTLFAKVIMIKFILTLIVYSITRELKLDYLSLSLSTVVFMVLFGSFNCYWVIPFFKLNLPLTLIHINNLGKHICLFFENSSVKGDSISLKQGVKNIVTTLPIFGRYLGEGIDILSKHTRSNMISPFKQVNNNVIRWERAIIPLTSVSKFTTISMPKTSKSIEVSYLYKGSISNLDMLLKNNILFFKGVISIFIKNKAFESYLLLWQCYIIISKLFYFFMYFLKLIGYHIATVILFKILNTAMLFVVVFSKTVYID